LVETQARLAGQQQQSQEQYDALQRQREEERQSLQREIERLQGERSALQQDRDIQLQSRQQEETLTRRNQELGQQVETLRAELEREREQDSKNKERLAVLDRALETAHTGAADEVARSLAENPSAAENGPQSLQDNLLAAQRQFERERALLQSTVDRLRDETARLRQALEIVGVYNE
jgi:hypothetical protein